MTRFRSSAALVALLFLFASPLFAATYMVPPDREMIQRADDIVVASAITSTVRRTPEGGIVTEYTLRIEDVLKGGRQRGAYLTLTELGGELPGLALYVSGMPVYEAGRRYLVFTEMKVSGDTSTWGLELGEFALENDGTGRQLALRVASGFDQNNWEPYREDVRDAEGFLDYIRGIVAQTIDPTPRYFVTAASRGLKEEGFRELFTRGSYLSQGSPRWQSTPNASVKTAGTPSGANGVSALNAANSAWNGVPGATINYSNGGVDDTATAGFTSFDSKSVVLYGDPNNEVNPPVIGRGGYWSTGATYSLGGETFKAIDGGIDVVMDNISWSQCLLNVALLHEMGHTLGFRHSNQNADGVTACGGANECTSTAVMNSSVSCSLTTLQTWDRNAASTVYGTGPTCTPPSITTQPPATKTITSGEQVNVTVSVSSSSTTPLTYQWYKGNTGDLSTPVAGQTTATNTDTPTVNTTYWVRVTGQCAPVADSTAVAVTVNPPSCTGASISQHPQSQTISSGGSAFLSVTAAGTGNTFQWYRGLSGDTSNAVGTNSATFNTGPLTATTSFWVRVQAQCLSPADSNTATITVTATTCPDVNVSTPTATQQTNGSYLLDVVASSSTRPLTYQWFVGPVPGSGNLFGTGKPITAPAPTAPTSYWVRVFNDCGKSADSPAVVTIAPCSLPVLTTDPADQSIANGASATLTVAFTSATQATVRWYRGAAPDKTTEVGQGVSLNTGALTQTTQFFASITNSCGETLTRTVTITVGSACQTPTITALTPASPAKKNKGEFITLTVFATGGAPLNYQWYEGVQGDTSNPRGTDASFTAGPLTASTKFWVKVSNACGNTNSPTINVDVGTPRHRSVRH